MKIPNLLARLFGQAGGLVRRGTGLHGKFIPLQNQRIRICKSRRKRLTVISSKRWIYRTRVYPPGFAFYITLEDKMTKREAIHKELAALYMEGAELAVSFQKKEEKQFNFDYQRWFTKALKAVASLASDRHAEFRGYYEINPKRKSLGYGTYVIQDYLKGVAPGGYQYEGFDARNQVLNASSIN